MDMRQDFLNFKTDTKWIEWFVGFCDADANFQVFPKKRSYVKKKDGKLSEYINIGYGFHLSLSEKDANLLKEIQLKLNGIGNYYDYPEKEESRLAITKKIELEFLIKNVFEKATLLTEHQRKRYAVLRHGILKNITRVENQLEFDQFIENNSILNKIEDSYFKEGTAFDNWIVGFINGEGCFHVHNKNFLEFSIEHTDKPVLEFIRENFQFNPVILERGDRSGTRKNTYSLRITSKKDIETLKNFFESENLNKLEGNKLIQYFNWKVKA